LDFNGPLFSFGVDDLWLVMTFFWGCGCGIDGPWFAVPPFCILRVVISGPCATSCGVSGFLFFGAPLVSRLRVLSVAPRGCLLCGIGLVVLVLYEACSRTSLDLIIVCFVAPGNDVSAPNLGFAPWFGDPIVDRGQGSPAPELDRPGSFDLRGNALVSLKPIPVG
jgi:hypothetical protein